MWNTLIAIFNGRSARVENRLIENNAALILEQKVREAEAGHAAAKRSLAALIARSRAEAKALAMLQKRIDDLTSRVREALGANKEKLAADGAALLADLENEKAVRERAKESADDKAARLRLALEKTQRQLVDLRQGLITAKAIEAERRGMRQLKGDLAATAAIREGEAVLKQLLESDDPVAEIEALEEIESSLSGDDVIDRMSAAGFGEAVKIRAEDILNRMRAEQSATA